MKLPEIGQKVLCPADRGAKPFTGTVTWLSQYHEINHLGATYVWVEVRDPSGNKALWPSNRLGVKL